MTCLCPGTSKLLKQRSLKGSERFLRRSYHRHFEQDSRAATRSSVLKCQCAAAAADLLAQSLSNMVVEIVLEISAAILAHWIATFLVFALAVEL